MVFASYSDVAALVGRVALGALFVSHGWPKIKDITKPVGFVKGTGWPGGAAFAVLFTLLEFFGGLALIIGLLTQIVAVLFVLEMIATTMNAELTTVTVSSQPAPGSGSQWGFENAISTTKASASTTTGRIHMAPQLSTHPPTPRPRIRSPRPTGS